MKKTFFVLAMLLISSIALAEIPNYITVQGKLTDANDLPVASGSYLFNFTVWNDPTSVNLINRIWTEQFTVTVTNGLFNTVLSPPPSVAFDKPYFLEVRVGTTTTNLKLLQPRVNITSAGYAFVSAGISGDLDMKGKSIENVWIVRNPSGQDLWIGLTDSTKSIGFYDYANSWNVFRYNGASGERDVDFYRNLSMNGNYVCLANGCRSDWPTSSSSGWSVGTYVTNTTTGARVGIGTANPVQKLDVVGNINTTGNMYFSTAGSAISVPFDFKIWDKDYSKNRLWWTWASSLGDYVNLTATGSNQVNSTLTLSSDSGLLYNYNGNEQLRISTGGNVGIGTTSPSYKLDVQGGDVRFQNTNDIALFAKGTSGLTSYNRIDFFSGTGSAVGKSERFSLYVNENDPIVQTRSLQLWQYPSDSLGGCCHQHAIFGIDSSGNNYQYFSGNVGIGTTTPGAKLEVAGQIKITGGTPGLSKVLTSDASGLASWQAAAGGLSGGSINNLTKWTSSTTVGNSIIYDNGNVGIGTATPYHQLSLGSNLANTKLAIWDSGSGTSFGLGAQSSQFRFNVNGASDKFSFLAGEAGSEIFTIQGGGNVGIGTASPGYKLDVVGDIRAQNAWLRTTGNTGWYSDTYAGGWYMSDPTWIRTYNSKNVWTDTGLLGSNGGLTVGYSGTGSPSGGAIIAGTVGIGTNSPTAKLHVNGNMIVDSSGESQFRDSTIYVLIQPSNANGNGRIGVYQTGSGFKNLLLNDGGGNVGIGTTSPTAKLHLGGSTGSTPIMKIDSNSVLEFGAGISKQGDAGKIGYQTFTTDALDIVGAGTGTPRKVKIWDNLDVGGSINIGGGSSIMKILSGNYAQASFTCSIAGEYDTVVSAYVGTEWATTNTKVFVTVHERVHGSTLDFGSAVLKIKDAYIKSDGYLKVKVGCVGAAVVSGYVDYLLMR